jgi:hypothetical protein
MNQYAALMSSYASMSREFILIDAMSRKSTLTEKE